MPDDAVPKGKVSRKRSEGLRLASKGYKDLPGRKRLHFLVAIAFNRGVVLAQQYEHMSGEYFSDFVRKNLSKLFTGGTKHKGFVMDNDTLFAILPRWPDPIKNLVYVTKSELEAQSYCVRHTTGIIARI